MRWMNGRGSPFRTGQSAGGTKFAWPLAICATIAVAFLPVAAQKPAIDPHGASLADEVEAIHKARVVTRVLFITAHPDDEASSLVTYLSRGAGDDVALLTLTRGQGGQNAIGPEQGDQLGVVRSAELLAAAQTYGVHLYFSRAPDFGFSKTLEETLRIWGDVPLEDMVRMIRAFRPEVVINGWGGVHTGHGNHQASGVLTPEAVEAAADPSKYPDQLRQPGLTPWKVDLLVQLARGQTPNGVLLPVNEISPVRGESYAEIGREGFMNQRSQGVVAFQNAAFLQRPSGLVKADDSAFDPAQLSEPLSWLATRFPTQASLLQPALERADQNLKRANDAALALDWPAAAAELARAGKTIQNLEDAVKTEGTSAAELGFELAQVRQRIDHALSIAAAVHLTAQSDRANIVGGESFTVRVALQHRQDFPDSEFATPTLELPGCWSSEPQTGQPGTAGFKVTAAAEACAEHTGAAATALPPREQLLLPEMLPFPPALLRAQVRGTIEGYSFDSSTEVMAQHATPTTVVTEALRLVPPVNLVLQPTQFIVAQDHAGAPQPLDILVEAHAYSNAETKPSIGLDVPSGWHVSAPQDADLKPGGDALLRFTVTPPAKFPAGNYALKAWAKVDDTAGDREYRTSIEPLPSLPTYLQSEPAVTAVHAFAITVPANLRVGYIAADADIDPVPDALRRVGLDVELLDPAALTFGDLGRFDAIVVGIRAYELRSDALAATERLLHYASSGGTLLVEYQRNWGSLHPTPAPYPAKMEGATIRITDETSPVRFTDPNSALLNYPNKITQSDFNGWVQERGNYFWTSWDAHYQTALAMRDPGEQEELGSLVWTRWGKGVYIYTGIEFFRQLPEGNAGAYRLMVNLLSQSRAK
jgi:LmbE family N-acetylglucosaminyl deacetylase